MNTAQERDLWAEARLRFEDAYGDPPDLNDPHDVAGFYPLLSDLMADAFMAAAREGIRIAFEERDDLNARERA